MGAICWCAERSGYAGGAGDEKHAAQEHERPEVGRVPDVVIVRHDTDVGDRRNLAVQMGAHVALNIFTNYFNNTAAVEVDFPKIALRQSA